MAKKTTKNSKSDIKEKESIKPQAKKAKDLGEKSVQTQALLKVFASKAFRAFKYLKTLFWERSWVVSILVASIIACSLGTYSQNDPAWTISTDTQVSNYCGLWGAWLADLMITTFGLSAWWFVLGFLMIAFFAIRSAWRRKRGEKLSERINPPKFTACLGFICVLIGSVSLEALRLKKFSSMFIEIPGGILGIKLASSLQFLIGVGLTTVFFFALIVIGLSLFLDFSWVSVSETIGRAVDILIVDRFRKEKQTQKIPVKVQRETEEDCTRVVLNPEAKVPEEITETPLLEPEKEEKTKVKIFKSNAKEVNDIKNEPKVSSSVTVSEQENIPHPSLNLLKEPDLDSRGVSKENLEMTSRLIVSKLKSYGIECKVMSAQPGPVITQYWLEPGEGVKGSQIENTRDDLRRALGVKSVRIVQNIPGTSYLGIEVPNPTRETVRLKEILKSSTYTKSESLLSLAIGKDIAGKPFVMDLVKTPHLLVAGTTGSGKSVGVNSMILSMLYRTDPSQLRLVLIDPKMLEFSPYDGIPHLLCPVVTDMNKAATALKWLVKEMDRRYSVMSKIMVRQFSQYNVKVKEAIAKGEPIRDPLAAQDDPNPPMLEPWPFIVCIIDELADLMLTNRKEVEGEITRLTQKARAAGIHLIIATQRPSVDVVTSIIKANVPTRISFQVASAIDSRVILGEPGAEQLLGYGDMLLHRPGDAACTRIQGCFVDDDEVNAVVEELKKFGSPVYINEVIEAADEDTLDGSGAERKVGESDPLYDKAVSVVIDSKRPTISYVQRQLGIGYNRAANLIEAMEAAGIVSKANATGKREILVEHY